MTEKRQYYYQVNWCPANSPSDAECACWHDEGTGPLADTRWEPKEWRVQLVETKPTFTIKPLVWAHDDGECSASSIIGTYYLGSEHDAGWSVWPPSQRLPDCATLELAKAAAEDHYRARIMEALTPSANDM